MTVAEFDSRRVAAEGADRLARALTGIRARAAEHDRAPRFPVESFAYLRDAAVLQAPAVAALEGGQDRLPEDARVVRAVASVDGSSARILDGHLNGVERLAMLAPEPLRSSELAQIAEGRLLLGVWGADPDAGEDPPAQLLQGANGPVLRGVKVFCSGAGGVDRALVVAADHADGRRRLVYLDTSHASADFITVDRGWYRASGLRASESHRVRFHDTPVMAVLGGPDALAEEPWFSRDAVRTAATWAGLARCIVEASVGEVDPGRLDEVRAHTLGRMRVALSTIELWMEQAVTALRVDRCGDPSTGAGDCAGLAARCRIAISQEARAIVEAGAQLAGSRALVTAGALDRARRDLDLFLLQHRLDSRLVALGRETARAEGERS